MRMVTNLFKREEGSVSRAGRTSGYGKCRKLVLQSRGGGSIGKDLNNVRYTPKNIRGAPAPGPRAPMVPTPMSRSVGGLLD